MDKAVLPSQKVITKLIREAKKLSGRPRVQFSELARTLCELHALDPSAFREAAKETGLSLRTAYYLLSIGQKVKDHPQRDRLERLGWTKLKILIPHFEMANFRSVLAFAETHTAEECRRHLRDQDTKEKTRCMLLRFTPHEYARFSAAVVNAGGRKKGKGLAGTEAALLKIIARAKLK
jgi:hypothetical protein